MPLYAAPAPPQIRQQRNRRGPVGQTAIHLQSLGFELHVLDEHLFAKAGSASGGLHAFEFCDSVWASIEPVIRKLNFRLVTQRAGHRVMILFRCAQARHGEVFSPSVRLLGQGDLIPLAPGRYCGKECWKLTAGHYSKIPTLAKQEASRLLSLVK